MGELWIAFACRGGRLAWPSLMDLKLLIDGIVRQTTVLIAQLSTSAGVRAPLAHVADQVFLELAREIEALGVGRRVAADMFGMALRSYQKKMQRLTESASEPGRDGTLAGPDLDLFERISVSTKSAGCTAAAQSARLSSPGTKPVKSYHDLLR